MPPRQRVAAQVCGPLVALIIPEAADLSPMPPLSSCDVDSLLSRLAERPRVWPSQQEWMLAELANLIERSDRMGLERAQASLAPDARLSRPGATRLLLDLVHESIPPAAMLGSDSLVQQEAVAAQACRVVHGMLTGGHKGLRAAAVDGGVVPLMAMVLMVAADASTHVWALSALGAMLRGGSSDAGSLAKAATDAGAADATLASLQLHPASAEVQRRGIEVLAALVVDGGAPACAALRAGCVDAAALALRHGRHASHTSHTSHTSHSSRRSQSNAPAACRVPAECLQSAALSAAFTLPFTLTLAPSP